MRNAVDNLLIAEGNVRSFVNTAMFLDILSLVLIYFGQASGAFTSAYLAYEFAVSAQNASVEVHAYYNIAGSRYCRLEQDKV